MTNSEQTAVRWFNLAATPMQQASVRHRVVELAKAHLTPGMSTRECTVVVCRLFACAVFDVVADGYSVAPATSGEAR